MPPFDPVQVMTSPMDPHQHQHQHHQQQHPQMYATYYAPPAYHGHTGYAQAFVVSPPPPQPAGWGWAPTGPGQPPAAYAVGVPPQQAQAPPQGQAQEAPAPSPSYEVILPHENDVLMGRGGKNNQHVGNERLRDMARSVRDRYKASQKKGKSNMSRDLVQKIRELDPPGRFLKRNPVTSEWEDVGDEIAREKVSQVLRDAVSEWTGPKAQAREEREREENAAETTKNDDDDKERTEPATTKPTPAVDVKRTSSPNSSRANSPSRAAVSRSNSSSPVPSPSPAPAPLPAIEVPIPAIASRTVTETPNEAVAEQSTPSPPPSSKDIPVRARLNTAESDISLDDLSVATSIDEELDQLPDNNTPTSTGTSIASNNSGRRQFRRMPVQHVPFSSFRRKTNLLDRYSNMNMGLSSSDMSIQSIGSQLSSRHLETQLSSKQLMSTGARQMSSRQLSSRQLSSRQLSSRTLSSRQLSSRQLSSRGLLSQQQRKQYLDMMGDSNLSLESLSISGDSRQASRKNLMMDQYMAMDMGLSDFSLGSLPEGDTAQPIRVGGVAQRPSVIIEGDLEELSEHENSVASLNVKPEELMDLYNTAGVGTSISNMTMNTIGTFSGHSRMSKGLYATGNSMRLESGHSFVQGAGDLQLDMLDDELFDEMDVLDDADEFSSDFI